MVLQIRDCARRNFARPQDRWSSNRYARHRRYRGVLGWCFVRGRRRTTRLRRSKLSYSGSFATSIGGWKLRHRLPYGRGLVTFFAGGPFSSRRRRFVPSSAFRALISAADSGALVALNSPKRLARSRSRPPSVESSSVSLTGTSSSCILVGCQARSPRKILTVTPAAQAGHSGGFDRGPPRWSLAYRWPT